MDSEPKRAAKEFLKVKKMIFWNGQDSHLISTLQSSFSFIKTVKKGMQNDPKMSNN